MSGFLSKIFGDGAKGLIDGVRAAADTFIQTKDEKAAFELAVENVVTERLTQIENSARTETAATMEIIKAEMAQGDNYTKRARPTVVYFGLLIIGWNYAIRPFFSITGADGIEVPMLPVALPDEFWFAWGSVVSIWSMGRTAERIGVKSKVTEVVTGNRFRP